MRHIFIAAMLLFSIAANAKPFSATVVAVVDGKTLIVKPFTKVSGVTTELLRIDLFAIRPPPANAWPWGPLARGTLRNFAMYNGAVRCEILKMRDQSATGICKRENVDLSESMIMSGYAHFDIDEYFEFKKAGADLDQFLITETRAMKAGHGIWKTPLRDFKNVWFPN
jgi:endonuclease YncB( thermonuclease family)